MLQVKYYMVIRPYNSGIMFQKLRKDVMAENTNDDAVPIDWLLCTLEALSPCGLAGYTKAYKHLARLFSVNGFEQC